jgi:hypothetical protein
MKSLLGVSLAIAALMMTGCAQPTGASGPLTPLVVGTEHHATVDWRPAASEHPTVVWGYVYNHSPYTFDHVRVLVDALDANGQILGQQVVWSPGLLGGGGRNYYEARMGPAPAYRARVFAWDRVETNGRRRWPFP